MRERVDQLGVAEPEIQRSGSDQIDVSLPDVKNADEAAVSRSARPPSCTSTTGSRTSSAPAASRRRPTRRSPAAASGRTGVGGHSHTTPCASPPSAPRTNFGTTNGAVLPRRHEDASASSPAPRRRAPTSPPRSRTSGSRRPRPTARSSRSTRARSSSAPSSPTTTRRPLGPLLRPQGQPGAERHRHQEPRAELRQRPGGERPAQRHVRLHGQGRGRSGRTRRAQIAQRARSRSRRAGARQASFQHFAIVLDNELISVPYISCKRQPGRHRRPDGSRDLGRLHDRLGAGPGQPAQDRRAADQARADLAVAGLGHAGQAGARPGPDRGHRRASRSSRSSCSSSTACSGSSRSARWSSTRSTSSR